MMIKEIFMQSIKDSTGSYSSKKLTEFASFSVAVILAFWDMYQTGILNPLAFIAFMGLAGYQSNLSTKMAIEQQKIDNPVPDNQPITPSTTTKTDISIEKTET